VWDIARSTVNGRFLFLCGTLLLFANVAFGDGSYQRTKNGRTLVWNDHPKPRDQATWTGARDREGYAHGFGTLTWYSSVPRESETSSANTELYARYWGNMVRGKLDGAVNVHSKRKTHYAIFTDGVRRTHWAPGPAPSRAMTEWRATVAAARSSTVPEPEPPAAGPVSGGTAKAQNPTSKSEIAESSQRSTSVSATRTSESFREDSSEPSEDHPKVDVDDSLRLLAWPPRSLRIRSVSSPVGANPETAWSPPASARLTKEEVVDLANAVARSHRYNLAEYQSPAPQYDPVDETWSLLYDEKRVGGSTDIGKHFSVAVDDKTKRTVLVSGN
jgi:hypothetical protein